MDTNEFEEIAYSMVEAYENNTDIHEDIKEVLDQFPHAERRILNGMWHAIAAYRDIK